KLLEEQFPSKNIETHVMDFQKQPLPFSENSKRVVIFPSANIGNTIGFYGQNPIDNPFINSQLENFREQADYLVLVYDTLQDRQKLRQLYNTAASEKFVLGAFQTVKSKLNVQG